MYDSRVWSVVADRVIYTSVAIACHLESLETPDRVAVVNAYMPPAGSSVLKCSTHCQYSGEESMRAEFLSLVD